VGEMMTNDKRVPLISATGSILGKIAQTVKGRLGRSLLELGGNNAIIVTPDADIKMTVIGAVLSCNCWTKMYFNPSFDHESIYDKVKDAVVAAYQQLSIGIH
jgi:aldehyde dehydrogenase (NAD+)